MLACTTSVSSSFVLPSATTAMAHVLSGFDTIDPLNGDNGLNRGFSGSPRGGGGGESISRMHMIRVGRPYEPCALVFN